jgi:hypothetical protein
MVMRWKRSSQRCHAMLELTSEMNEHEKVPVGRGNGDNKVVDKCGINVPTNRERDWKAIMLSPLIITVLFPTGIISCSFT